MSWVNLEINGLVCVPELILYFRLSAASALAFLYFLPSLYSSHFLNPFRMANQNGQTGHPQRFAPAYDQHRAPRNFSLKISEELVKCGKGRTQ
ncbi:hypothetical protein M422DRAFT_37227 [Sphaerobolus stellatus SS14]|uniref:Uncharacterized protein n=1 Tax=Sphaerobolus stellatus (strain SS14) TaxID=990650 RepID=A0A0C9UU02_SPHS4|nr:hypothetical protein M422DRAFT_37227 [Sphaerobolus stellatus SS14]